MPYFSRFPELLRHFRAVRLTACLNLVSVARVCFERSSAVGHTRRRLFVSGSCQARMRSTLFRVQWLTGAQSFSAVLSVRSAVKSGSSRTHRTHPPHNRERSAVRNSAACPRHVDELQRWLARGPFRLFCLFLYARPPFCYDEDDERGGVKNTAKGFSVSSAQVLAAKSARS